MSQENFDDEFWEGFQTEVNRINSEPPTPKKEKKDCYKILNFYHLLLEGVLTWSSRKDYLVLVRNFLDTKIDGLQLEEAFFDLWYSNQKKLRKLIETIEDGDKENQIPDLYYTSESIALCQTINNLFFCSRWVSIS